MEKLLDKPATRDLLEGFSALVEELISSLRPLAILVAGSLARGRFVRGMSDIDLLVLTEEPPSKRDRFRLVNVGGVDVEITVLGFEEALRSAEEGNFFVRDALENGITIYQVRGIPRPGGSGGDR